VSVARSKPSASNKLVTLGAIALVVAALYFGREVLIPFSLAVVLTFLLTPVVSRLEKLHLGRMLSVLLVLLIGFAGIGTVGWLAAGQLVEITRQLPDYKANIHTKLQSIRGNRDGDFTKAASTLGELSKELTKPPDAPATPAASPPRRPTPAKATSADAAPGSPDHPLAVSVAAPPLNVVQQLEALLGSLLGPLETAGVVVIFTLFMLVKREDLRDRVIRLAGHDRLHNITKALDDGTQRLSRFLLVQFVVNASYGTLFGLGLYALKVPHALLFGALGGILRYVPYLGPVIGAAFPVALTVAVFPGWTEVGMVVALFLILELIVANILEPMLYGAHTGISPLAVLVAAVFWAELWGPAGLILSTPLTLCVMVMGRHVLQLKFLEIVLGDEPVLSPESHLYQRLLAMDQEEVGEIAHTYLKGQELGDLYDAVLIPALGFAEQDRHNDVLDADKEKFIYNCTDELIEELIEHPSTESVLEGDSAASPDAPRSGARVLCLPSRDQSDELVAKMLTQLLQRAGYRAQSLPIGAVEDMLKQVGLWETQIVCVSALPPFAVGQARSLCKRLRASYPGVKLIVGLWNYDDGIVKAQERFQNISTDLVTTSLAGVLEQIGQLADATVVEELDARQELARSLVLSEPSAVADGSSRPTRASTKTDQLI
jgi:predicted PurR-regulated permease PerM